MKYFPGGSLQPRYLGQMELSLTGGGTCTVSPCWGSTYDSARGPRGRVGAAWLGRQGGLNRGGKSEVATW